MTTSYALKIDEAEKPLTPGEMFYLVNHLDVLGVERGSKQVARHLERQPFYLKNIYFLQKKKTHHKM